ncbi:MAG: hypothetical protein RIR45_914, partial [Pseudomonadota bacterium]
MNAPVPHAVLNASQALAQVGKAWDEDIVHRLQDYIRIPAKSPMFDADWASHGYIETVVRDTATWIEAQKVPGLSVEIVRLEGRTPVLFFELAATRPDAAQTVLMYGHLDKQPEFT